MKRGGPLKRKTPLRQRRASGPDTEREPRPMALAPTLRPVSRGTYGGSTKAAAPKQKPHRSQKLRDSANGEPCLVALPGCTRDPRMTIWSHYRGSAGGKAGARKSDDICGAYACTYCDAVYDGQRPRPPGLTKEDVDRLWLEGHIRSLVRLAQKGLLG